MLLNRTRWHEPSTQNGVVNRGLIAVSGSNMGELFTGRSFMDEGDSLVLNDWESPPFPRTAYDTNRKAALSVTRVNQWIIDSTVSLAEYCGNELVQVMYLNETAKNFPPASGSGSLVFMEDLGCEIKRKNA